MLSPKFETWFKEGILKPNYHYILIKDDFSDLEDVFNYFSGRPDKCEEIKRNANQYVEIFKDNCKRLNLSRIFVQKYCKLNIN